MTTKDRIAAYLQVHPEGVDDGELTRVLGILNHAHTNAKCHELQQEGYLRRDMSTRPLKNIWLGNPYNQERIAVPAEELPVEEYKKTWYWEGNVQNAIIDYLSSTGYDIISHANTQTHERGIDVIAKKGDQELWVTVKGYPRKKIKVNPRLQCIHWFSSALYDIIKYRERNKTVNLAIALPDFERYRNVARGVTWFKEAGSFSFIWVHAGGAVDEQ